MLTLRPATVSRGFWCPTCCGPYVSHIPLTHPQHGHVLKVYFTTKTVYKVLGFFALLFFAPDFTENLWRHFWIPLGQVVLVPNEDGWCCWYRLCKYCNLIYGEWKGGRTSKRWGSCLQTRDKSGWVFASRAKKLVLQVSKQGIQGSKGLGWIKHCLMCENCYVWSVNNKILCSG